MIELAWFAAGAFVATVAVAVLRPRPRQAPRRRARFEPLVPAPAPLLPGPITADARRVALTLAEELATLVSGVEGRAHHLIDSAPDRARLPLAAEALQNAIQRLRTLHSKLVAFGRARTAAAGSTDVATMISGLRDELEHMQLGIEICWEPRSDVPPISGAPDHVRDALLFLCAALLRAERGATRLTIVAEPCFATTPPRVQLEVAVEWVAEPHARATDLFTDPSFTLDLEAANNLVAALDGDVTVTHLPGRSVRAVVHWNAAAPIPDADAATAEPEPSRAAPRRVTGHEYGGALLLEADPSVRAMIAAELKASGRAVFACADGASARSFLEATPDRFELLFVDHRERLDADGALLATIRRLAPELKVFLVAGDEAAPIEALPRAHRIDKPFGVHELRRALASVLAG